MAEQSNSQPVAIKYHLAAHLSTLLRSPNSSSDKHGIDKGRADNDAIMLLIRQCYSRLWLYQTQKYS
jgi:hypothetical protein